MQKKIKNWLAVTSVRAVHKGKFNPDLRLNQNMLIQFYIMIISAKTTTRKKSRMSKMNYFNKEQISLNNDCVNYFTFVRGHFIFHKYFLATEYSISICSEKACSSSFKVAFLTLSLCVMMKYTFYLQYT